jgi:hypothetical protein
MVRPLQRNWPSRAKRDFPLLGQLARTWGLVLLVGCAAGNTAPAALNPESAQGHLYPLPLDNVLAQSARLMVKQGWTVKRVGNVLVTNWHATATDARLTYRIFGQRVDGGLSTLRVERVVATQSTSFGTDHPVTESLFPGILTANVNSNFAADTVADSTAGTAPPPGVFSPADLARPSPWVVSHQERDAQLELELQREIDPTLDLTAEAAPQAHEALVAAGRLPPSPGPTPSGEPGKVVSPAAATRLADLAGIWEGTFHFKGNMTGTYTGEVSVAVEDGTAEVADFCPERGGTLTALGEGEVAAWQGDLACPPISIKGCPSSVIRYSAARATLQGGTLVLVAAGNVETPATCGFTSGALSVAFVAQRADYIHLAVTRVNQPTSCVWPSDWEDFNSVGSMAMPDRPGDADGYLGVIRAKGSRLGEIEQLLRRCHQVVRLHGVTVLMRLAAAHPPTSPRH